MKILVLWKYSFAVSFSNNRKHQKMNYMEHNDGLNETDVIVYTQNMILKPNRCAALFGAQTDKGNKEVESDEEK